MFYEKGVTFVAQPGKKLVLSTEDSVSSKVPKFAMISTEESQKDFPDSMDMLRVLPNLGTGKRFYYILLDNWDHETGLALVQSKNFTPEEKAMNSRSYRDLKEKGLVLRLRPNTYLLNPYAFISRNKGIRPALFKLWEEAKGKYK